MLVLRAVRLRCCPAGRKAERAVALNNGSMVWINCFDHVTLELLEEQACVHSEGRRRAVVLNTARLPG